MTDIPSTPDDALPLPTPGRHPDGSGNKHDAEREQLDELFAALRRLTF